MGGRLHVTQAEKNHHNINNYHTAQDIETTPNTHTYSADNFYIPVQRPLWKNRVSDSDEQCLWGAGHVPPSGHVIVAT